MNALGPVTVPAHPPGAELLNAPLFASLIERLQAAEERCVVLDLGSARTEALALFGQLRARLDIIDLAESLDQFEGTDEPDVLRERAERLLPPRHGDGAHVVLCWDLLNYLARPALTALTNALADRARRGAYAHALIAYSSARMGAQPGCFVPADGQQIMNVAPAQGERASPRYSPEDLATCMHGYTVERVRLLRNGMQEYLFRL